VFAVESICSVGRGQVVRHQVLVLAFGGSNPSAPAIYCSEQQLVHNIAMTHEVDDRHVFYYAPSRYYVGIGAVILIAVSALIYGFIDKAWTGFAFALVLIAFSAIFAKAVKQKLRPGAVALTANGELLIGGELVQPLPIAETSFDTTSDYQGSWVIRLYYQGSIIRLGAGGWKLRNERFITRDIAERELLAFGLQKRLTKN